MHDLLRASDKFDTPMGVLQVQVQATDALYPQEQFVVDIRCKARPERTDEKLLMIKKALGEHLQNDWTVTQGRIRIEKFDLDAQTEYHFGGDKQ